MYRTPSGGSGRSRGVKRCKNGASRGVAIVCAEFLFRNVQFVWLHRSKLFTNLASLLVFLAETVVDGLPRAWTCSVLMCDMAGREGLLIKPGFSSSTFLTCGA